MVGTVAGSKLDLIARQIRRLQEEAQTILTQAKRDLDLHRARCAFPRRPGSVYHLYRRPSGEHYWSMVSPDEWGGAPPHEFAGSYRLETDQSWTAIEDEEDRDVVDAEAVLSRLLP